MKITLHYFDLAFWRGEMCRLALNVGDIEFEDARIKDFAAFKNSDKCPYGQVPILEVDGTIIAQSGGIARICGKHGNLYPKGDDLASALDAAKIDEIIDCCQEMSALVTATLRMSDEEKAATLKKVFEGRMKLYLAALEKRLTENGSGFLVGFKISIADLAVWRLIGNIKEYEGVPKFIDEYPALKKHNEEIGNNEKIKAWVDSHYPKQA